MITSIITSKGQTTLPKVVREALGVLPGDSVRYVIYENREVKIFPVLPLSRLFGSCKYDGPPVDLDDMDRAIADGAAGK